MKKNPQNTRSSKRSKQSTSESTEGAKHPPCNQNKSATPSYHTFSFGYLPVNRVLSKWINVCQGNFKDVQEELGYKLTEQIEDFYDSSCAAFIKNNIPEEFIDYLLTRFFAERIYQGLRDDDCKVKEHIDDFIKVVCYGHTY